MGLFKAMFFDGMPTKALRFGDTHWSGFLSVLQEARLLKYISLKESLDSKILTQSNSFWRQQISQLFRWSWDRAGHDTNLGRQTES